MKVLVVDDDIGILESFEYMLKDRCDLELINSGIDALHSLELERPSLVFLDIKMPDMNGLDVLKIMKRKYSDLKVVIITATEAKENMEIAMSLGVDLYLRKPLDVDDITRVVDSILN